MYEGSEQQRIDTERMAALSQFEFERKVRNWARDVYKHAGGDMSELTDAPIEELISWYREAHN